MRPDEWLAGHMGRAAYSVEGGDGAEEIRAAGEGFFQAKVPCVDVERVGELERIGFRVVDANVTLCRETAVWEVTDGPTVEPAAPADRQAVAEIAAIDYTVSRFHRDPAIPTATACAIKRDWVENFFRGRRGDRLLVARSGGEVIGFNLVLDGDVAHTIDLIAVASPARRTGAGRALVAAIGTEGADRPIQAGTQVANVAALRFYEHLAFRATDTRFVLHYHA